MRALEIKIKWIKRKQMTHENTYRDDMCVQVTKTANRFEISSLLEKILLKQVRWCLTFVGLYI